MPFCFLGRLCLLTDREINNLYRGPSIDASYHVLVHLAKRFQRRRCLRNRPSRNKNCLWWPCLLTNRDKMSNLYRRSFIDASYQVSFHLAKRLQRTRKDLNYLAFQSIDCSYIFFLPEECYYRNASDILN